MQEKSNGSIYYLNNPAVIIDSVGVHYLGHRQSGETLIACITGLFVWF